MQDPRLRILVTVTLSVAAFASVAGAVATLVWWACFASRRRALPRPTMLLGVIGMIAATAVVAEISGGAGFAYAIRMIAILMIATWTYADRRDGEMIDVFVWLLGDRIGFEIGLIAEMGLQSLEVIRQDVAQLQAAMALKGVRAGVRTIVPLAVNLIVTQLRRSEEQSRLLSVRGYTLGGRICPKFSTSRRELVISALAVLFAIFALIPVHDIFYSYTVKI